MGGRICCWFTSDIDIKYRLFVLTLGTWKSSRVGGRKCCGFTTSTDIEYRLCSNVQVPGDSVEGAAGYFAGSLPLSISNIDSLL